jgi:AcrR family transcriptional regulator
MAVTARNGDAGPRDDGPRDDGPPRRGRPRDAGAGDRITAAAIGAFTTGGWRSFSFEAVAKEAGVGKSTLYLRYRDKEELIRDVIRSLNAAFAVPDTGDVRADLAALATAYADELDGPRGRFRMRVMTESRLNDDFRAIAAAAAENVVAAAHEVVRRGKRRGQLPAGTSAAVLLDSLFGGLLHHHLLSSPDPAGHFYQTPAGRKFVRDLLDSVLRAAQAGQD